MGARWICGLLSSICALAVLPAPAAQPAPRYFTDIGRIVCAEGAERYLPGDYYFCAANKALQAGDHAKAVAMYEESAAWGDKRAMFNLGLLYLRGDGIARNEALALAWLALSAERAEDLLQRQVLAASWTAASKDTRAAADALWMRMKPTYTDAVALARARQRYDRETALLRRALQRDPTISLWIVGLNPSQGGGVLETLDAAAQDTVLRPSRFLRGAVKVGAPETVHVPATPTH
jgi:hypothetical protein